MNDYSIGQIKELAKKQLHGQWGKAIPLFFLYTLLVGVPNGTLGFYSNYVNMEQMDYYSSGVSPLVSFIIFIYTILVAGPFQVGISTITLRILRNREFGAGTLFEGFSRFGAAFCSYILVGIFSFLWALLFMILPTVVFIFGMIIWNLPVGVLFIAGVATFVMAIVAMVFVMRYQLTYFVVSDYPEFRAGQCVGRSVEMMKGNVGKLFLLNLSFIGWALLIAVPVFIATTALMSMSFFGIFIVIACFAAVVIGTTMLSVYMSVSQAVFYSIRSGNMVDHYNTPGFDGLAGNSVQFENYGTDTTGVGVRTKPVELEKPDVAIDLNDKHDSEVDSSSSSDNTEL